MYRELELLRNESCWRSICQAAGGSFEGINCVAVSGMNSSNNLCLYANRSIERRSRLWVQTPANRQFWRSGPSRTRVTYWVKKVCVCRMCEWCIIKENTIQFFWWIYAQRGAVWNSEIWNFLSTKVAVMNLLGNNCLFKQPAFLATWQIL